MSEIRLVPIFGDLIDVLGTEDEPEGWVDDLRAGYDQGITEEEAGELVGLVLGSWDEALTDMEASAVAKLRATFETHER
jgi:hypothetical protein